MSVLRNSIVVFLAVGTIFSPLRMIGGYNQLMAILLIMLMVLLALQSYRLKPKHTLFNILVYIYIIYTTVFPYLVSAISIGNRYLHLSLMPIFYLAYVRNKDMGQVSTNYIIILLVSPFIVLSSIFTIKAYQSNDYASRAAKHVDQEGLDLLASGVGGYELVYFMLFIAIIALFTVNRKTLLNINFTNVIIVVVLFVSTYIIVKSNYTIAAYLLYISLSLRILLYKITTARLIIAATILLFTVGFISTLVPIIFDLLYAFSFSNAAIIKLLEVEAFINSNYMGEAIFNRYSVYSYSYNAFVENPFWGALVDEKYQIAKYGNHSQTLDTFAFFGVGIGILQIYIYTKPLIGRLKHPKCVNDLLPYVILFSFCMVMTFNVLTTSIGFAVYFICMIYYDYINFSNNKGANNFRQG